MNRRSNEIDQRSERVAEPMKILNRVTGKGLYVLEELGATEKQQNSYLAFTEAACVTLTTDIR